MKLCKILYKFIDWYNDNDQLWVRMSSLLFSFTLSLLYFTFPENCTGKPFLYASAIVLVISISLYLIAHRTNEKQLFTLFTSAGMMLVLPAAIILCASFSRLSYAVPLDIRIWIITFVGIGMFGCCCFIHTFFFFVRNKIKEKEIGKAAAIKKSTHTVADGISALTAIVTLLAAVLNFLSTYMEALKR